VAQARFLILPRPFLDKPSWSKIAGELYARKPVRRGLISANSFPAGRFQLLVIHQFASPPLSTLLVL
jgi:hypothetical protein